LLGASFIASRNSVTGDEHMMSKVSVRNCGVYHRAPENSLQSLVFLGGEVKVP